MNSKDFKYYAVKIGFTIVNEFKDDNGEDFIILSNRHRKGYFIAGDKTDWEVLQLHKSGKIAFREFIFNDKEATTIKKVLELAEKT